MIFMAMLFALDLFPKPVFGKNAFWGKMRFGLFSLGRNANLTHI
jgi:hypothetical protein